MTTDKAIKIIKSVRFQFQSSLDEVGVDKDCAEAKEDNQKVVEAFDKAIEALEYQEEDKKTRAYRAYWADKGY